MNPLLYVLFVVSGALGLVYEVVWMRELSLVFGASAPAVATVLAVFMLGLALGAWALGRWIAARRVNPWRVYGVLEILIGAFAFAFPSALRALEPVFQRAYGSTMLGAIRFGAALLVLLPATFCLGGTLPVMARALDPLRSRFAGRLAWLYAANTSGAAIGAFLAPFFLLPALGAKVTLYGTPVLNLLVGIAALWLAGEAAIATPAATEGAVEPRRKLSPGLLLGLALLSGFVVILLEVVVTRLLAVYLGQSTYGFGLMLTCFVLGLALGAWAAGGLLRLVRSDARLLAPLLAVAALAIGLMMVVLQQVPWWLARGALSIHEQANPFVLFLGLQFLLAIAALLPATVALGTIFPVLLGSAGEGDAAASKQIGLLYGVNTAGSVAAALLGGFVLVPAIGTHAVIVLTGALTVLSALLVIAAGWRREAGFSAIAVVSAAAAIVAVPLLLVAGKPDRQVLLRSPWLYGRTEEQLAGYAKESEGYAIEYLGNDAHGTVGVGHRSSDDYRFFSVNGKVDGGNGADMATQVALGTWPCLMVDGGKRDPKNALVIGLGTGATAGAMLSFPLASLDVVEISPTMPRIAREFFGDVNRKALDDPRTHLVIGDGRHHLGYAKQKYDVIVSEPSNPWISGIGFLFTRESFQLMRDALEEGGVACQWLQIYDLAHEHVTSVIKTFSSVFPTSIVMMAQEQPVDLLLLGFKKPMPENGKILDLSSVQQAIARHKVPMEYASHSAKSGEDLLEFFMMGTEGIKAYTQDATLNTDDNAYLEFAAPKALATAGRGEPMLQAFGIFVEPAARYVDLSAGDAAALTQQSLNAAFFWRLGLRLFPFNPLLVTNQPAGVPNKLQDVGLTAVQLAQVEINDFKNLFGECSSQFHLLGVLSEYQQIPGQAEPVLMRYASGFNVDQARQYLEHAMQLEPDNEAIRLDLAMDCQFGKNGERWGEGWQAEKAIKLYREVLKRQPNDLDTKLHLISVLSKSGDVSQAEKLAFETYRANQNDAEVAATYGAVLQQHDKLGEARVVLEGALQRDASNVRALRQLGVVYARLGDKNRAHELMQQALNLNPNDPDTQAAIKQLDTLK